MVTVVMVAVLPALRKMAPAEEDVRVTTRFEVVLAGLPRTSCICTVMFVELLPAIRNCGAVVITSLVANPPKTVNVPETVFDSPGAVACTTALPARWPVKVTLFASPAATKSEFVTPPVELVSAQTAASLVTKLPKGSR